ncbi:MAG: cobalt ECF transporter T component CbiQ [candidate division WOR-3 bacterium]|nr:MAG: cobalt ECF transporter T component CbiQ [candidate division WOR-3 bacterium]
MIEERFSEGSSYIHNIDPRVRILGAVIYSIIIAVTGQLEVALAGLIAGIIFVALARLSAKQVFYRLLIVNTFIVMLWLILPFSYPGTAIFRVGSLVMTEEGIQYALMLTVKCNAIILLNISLLSTCGVFNLVHALDHFRFPNRLIHLLFFIYRYAHVMQHEYYRLRDTLKIRGFKRRTSLHTYRTYGSIIGTLMIRGYERSEQIQKAMVCRGFKGHYWLLDHFSWTRSDLVAAGMMALVAILLIILQWKIV